MVVSSPGCGIRLVSGGNTGSAKVATWTSPQRHAGRVRTQPGGQRRHGVAQRLVQQGPQSPPHQRGPGRASAARRRSPPRARRRWPGCGRAPAPGLEALHPGIEDDRLRQIHRHAPVPSVQQGRGAARQVVVPRAGRAGAGSTCWAKLLVTSTCIAAKSASESLPSPSNCRTRRARQSPNQSRPMNTGKSGGATRSLVLTMWPLAGFTTWGSASPLAQPTQSCAPSAPGCGHSPSPARRIGMRPVVNWPMPAGIRDQQVLDGRGDQRRGRPAAATVVARFSASRPVAASSPGARLAISAANTVPAGAASRGCRSPPGHAAFRAP